MRVLSEKHELQPNSKMIEGLLLEGYLWGFKNGDQDSLELGGLKSITPARQRTLDYIKKKSYALRGHFPADGKPFYVKNRNYDNSILTAEVDFYTPECLYDLKKSSSHSYWDNRSGREEFLQAMYYNFVLGTVLPFEYVVLADDTGLIKSYIIDVNEQDLLWIRDIVDTILSDPFHLPSYNCMQQTYGKCNYIEFCEEGKKELTKTKLVRF